MAENESGVGDECSKLTTSQSTERFEEILSFDSFVDKSLLISALFGGGDHPKVMITAPRRFGKTVNLNMLFVFLVLELDDTGKEKADKDKENLKLFTDIKSLQIMKNKKIVEKHFGKYPIIMVCLYTSDSVCSHDEALGACREAIHIAYNQHEYLYNANSPLRDDEKLDCKQWCRKQDYKNFPRSDVVVSLRNLSEYLRKFHGKRAFVLIDEFDAIISSAMFQIQNQGTLAKTLQLTIAIIGAVLKNNDRNVSGGVVTGILDMKGLNISSTMGNLDRYRFGINNLSVSFNGFLKDEVTALFEKWKLPEDLRSAALLKYNKYYDLNGKELYNPYAIIKFLASNILNPTALESYWEKSGYIVGMNKMFQNSTVVDIINKLFQKQNVSCLVSTDLQLETLIEYAKGSSCDDNGTTAIIFLLCQGYLTLSPDGERQSKEEKRLVRITNTDSERELKMHMINYFHDNCQLKRTSTKACAESLAKLPSLCKDASLAEFKKELLIFQTCLDVLLQTAKLVEPLNEPTLYSILMVVSLQAELMYGQQQEPVQARGFLLDVIIFNEKFGAVNEMKLYGSSSVNALLQIFGNRYYTIFASKQFNFAGKKSPPLSLLMGMHLNKAKHFTISFIRRQELMEVVNELNECENCENVVEVIDRTLEKWHKNADGKIDWFEKKINDVTIQKFLKKFTTLD